MNATWRRRAQAGLKEFACVLPVAWYPALFVYFRNCAEASFAQVWFPLGLFTAAAAAFFLAFAGVARHAAAGGLAAMAALLLAAFWQPVEQFARDLCWSLRYWHLVPLALVGLGLLAAALSWAARRRGVRLERVRTVFAALFAGLIVFNFVRAAPVLADQVREALRAAAAVPESTPTPAGGEMPNVYFIVLDEYAPFDQLEKYYGVRPVEFEAFLRERGFNVSATSRNPAFYTADVLAGLIGMAPPEKVTRFAVTADRRLDKLVDCPSQETVIRESRLMEFFKARGYVVYVASMLGDIFNVPTPLRADEWFVLPHDQRGISLENTVAAAVLERSAFEPLRYLLPVDVHFYNRMVEGIFRWIEKAGTLKSPRFLWAHVTCPHGPYLFEADGRWRHEPGGNDDPGHYLEQHRYVSWRVARALDALLAQDPGGVVLLMSDHSIRRNFRLPVDDMARIFMAVYCRGEKLDVEGLSGLDAEWLVLNRLFGTEFPVVRGPRPLAGEVP